MAHNFPSNSQDDGFCFVFFCKSEAPENIDYYYHTMRTECVMLRMQPIISGV